MKKISKTQLAVELSKIVTTEASDNNHLAIIRERQGNTATRVQALLKCGLTRADLIFSIQEALNDAEPVYLDRKANGATQKIRRMFSKAWAKTFEGHTLKIAGKQNHPAVTEIKVQAKDLYKPFQNAVKKLEGILTAKQIEVLTNEVTVAIEADKIKLQEALTAQAKQNENVIKRQEALLVSQVTDSFIALGIMKPTKEQVDNGVKALKVVNA